MYGFWKPGFTELLARLTFFRGGKLTTIVAWHNTKDPNWTPWIIADGRLSTRSSSSSLTRLTDTYPKLFEVPVFVFKTTGRGFEFDFQFAIGVAFSGSSVVSQAAVHTFKQFCARLLGSNPGKGPGLRALAALFAVIYEHHREQIGVCQGGEARYDAEFVLSGFCHREEKWKIFHLKPGSEKEPIQVTERAPNTLLVLGDNIRSVEEKIVREQATHSEGDLWYDRAALKVFHGLCRDSDPLSTTGGAISFGSGRPNSDTFGIYAFVDYDFNEQGHLISRMSVNGLDVDKVKPVLEGYCYPGFGLDLVPFSERVEELKAERKCSNE